MDSVNMDSVNMDSGLEISYMFNLYKQANGQSKEFPIEKRHIQKNHRNFPAWYL